MLIERLPTRRTWSRDSLDVGCTDCLVLYGLRDLAV